MKMSVRFYFSALSKNVSHVRRKATNLKMKYAVESCCPNIPCAQMPYFCVPVSCCGCVQDS